MQTVSNEGLAYEHSTIVFEHNIGQHIHIKINNLFAIKKWKGLNMLLNSQNLGLSPYILKTMCNIYTVHLNLLTCELLTRIYSQNPV